MYLIVSVIELLQIQKLHLYNGEDCVAELILRQGKHKNRLSCEYDVEFSGWLQ